MFKPRFKKKKKPTFRLSSEQAQQLEEEETIQDHPSSNKTKKKLQETNDLHDRQSTNDTKYDKDSEDEEEEGDGGGGGGGMGLIRARQRKRPFNKGTTQSLSVLEGEEKDESPSFIKKEKGSKKKKKKKSLANRGLMSFDLQEDGDNDNGDSSTRTKKKKRMKRSSGGLGFGGGARMMMMATMIDDEYKDQDEAAHDESNETSSSSMYGKEALEALKKQQRKYVIEEVPPEETNLDLDLQKDGHDTTKDIYNSTTPTVEETDKHNQKNDCDFIPLSTKSKSSTILAGEDAFQHIDNDDGPAYSFLNRNTTAKTHNNIDSMNDNLHEDPEDDSWEAQMEKRGMSIRGSTTTTKPSNKSLKPPTQSSASNMISSSSDISRPPPLHSNSNSNSNGNNNSNNNSNDNDNNSYKDNSEAVTKVMSTISSTIKNLTDNHNQMQATLRIRQVELESLTSPNSSFAKEEENLHTHGKAYDYFQLLRIQLVHTIGTIRQVNDKLDLLSQTFMDFMTDIGEKQDEEWRLEENDVVHWFRKNNNAHNSLSTSAWIREIIGREPPIEQDGSSEVDEFGRDLSSLTTMERNKRTMKRRALRKQYHNHHNTTDIFHMAQTQINLLLEKDLNDLLDTNYQQEQQDRLSALMNAVDIITMGSEDMDEQYLSMSNLLQIFQEWRTKYPEEYKQCYADLSLVDLIGVLVKIELYRDLDLLGIQNANSNHSDETEKDKTTTMIMTTTNNYNIQDFLWFKELEKYKEWTMNSHPPTSRSTSTKDNDVDITTTVMEGILEKTIVPHFCSILETAYNPFSKQQTKHMCQYASSFVSFMSHNTKLQQKLRDSIESCIQTTLQHCCIPVLNVAPFSQAAFNNNNNCNDDGDDDDGKTEAILFVIRQVLKVKQLVMNICHDWIPLLQASSSLQQQQQRSDFSQLILMDIVSNRILPSLSTWRRSNKEEHDQNDSIDPGKYVEMILKDIYNAVNALGWMENQSLMLFTSPLRAAMLPYDSQS